MAGNVMYASFLNHLSYTDQKGVDVPDIQSEVPADWEAPSAPAGWHDYGETVEIEWLKSLQ